MEMLAKVHTVFMLLLVGESSECFQRVGVAARKWSLGHVASLLANSTTWASIHISRSRHHYRRFS